MFLTIIGTCRMFCPMILGFLNYKNIKDLCTSCQQVNTAFVWDLIHGYRDQVALLNDFRTSDNLVDLTLVIQVCIVSHSIIFDWLYKTCQIFESYWHS